MAEKILLEVLTPEKAIVSEKVQIIIAPGSEGEFGALKGHAPFLTSLNIGMLRYKDAVGKENHLFINGGFAEVLPDKVTILAESAERKEDIDVQRAEKAQERAQKRLAAKAADIDLVRAEVALKRSLFRLKVKDL